MQFYSYSRDFPSYKNESQIYNILEKNQAKLTSSIYTVFNLIKTQEFWFILCNDNDDIIAECSVDDHCDYYEIHDVFVFPKFRGNHYSIMLIMNVMYYFASIRRFKIFKIYTSNINTAAYNIYTKVFGSPVKRDEDWTYWSSE